MRTRSPGIREEVINLIRVKGGPAGLPAAELRLAEPLGGALTAGGTDRTRYEGKKRLPSLDSAGAHPYHRTMSEEVSKRLDDLHKRFDDLRADIATRFQDLRLDVDTRFHDLRADMGARLAAADKRLDDMNKRLDDMNKRLDDMNQSLTKRLDDMNQSLTKRLDDMNQTLRTFMWVVSGWFTFLTAVLAIFGFLRR